MGREEQIARSAGFTPSQRAEARTTNHEGGSETHPYKDGAGRGGFPVATFQGIITL